MCKISSRQRKSKSVDVIICQELLQELVREHEDALSSRCYAIHYQRSLIRVLCTVLKRCRSLGRREQNASDADLTLTASVSCYRGISHNNWVSLSRPWCTWRLKPVCVHTTFSSFDYVKGISPLYGCLPIECTECREVNFPRPFTTRDNKWTSE